MRRRGAYSGGTGSGSVGDGPRAGHGGSSGVIGSGSSGAQAGERAGGASSGPPSFVDIARECAVPASVGPVTAVPRQQRRPAATAGRPGLAGQSPAAPGGRQRGQALGGARFAGELCQAEATGEPRHRVGREFDGVTVSRRPLHTSDRTGRPTRDLDARRRKRVRYFLAYAFFLAAGLVPAAAFRAAAGADAGATFAAGALFFFSAGREAATCAL